MLFKSSGVFSLIKVKLKICESGSEISFATFLITFTLKPSYPGLFLGFKFLIHFWLQARENSYFYSDLLGIGVKFCHFLEVSKLYLVQHSQNIN